MLQAAMEDQRLERLVRPEEVRMLLGISEPTFYRMVRDGAIPAVKVGGGLRVREGDLRQFLKSGLPLRQAVAV